MRVHVLFFGMVKDLVGRAEEELELPPGADGEALFAHYAAASPKLAALGGSILLARNREFTPRGAPLADGDEVALLPPVSGG